MPEQKSKSAGPFASATATAFSTYSRALHRYLRARIRDPSAVADLTQDIFERFLKVPHTETVRDTQGFLYGIAFNLIREYRVREKHSCVEFDSEMFDLATEHLEYATPDDAAYRLALQQELRNALGKLPPVHRAVLLLVMREGLSYAEAAQRAGLEESTVKRYVHEGRARVKQVLKRTIGRQDCDRGIRTSN